MSASTQPSSSGIQLLILVLFAAAAIGLVWKFTGPGELTGTRDPSVGTPLPPIALQPLTGGAVPVTTESLRGKVALINIWGTWCPPCRQEFPHLAALEKELRDRPDFRFVSVSCGGGEEDQAELTAETTQFLAEQIVTHPTWWDPIFTTRDALTATIKFNGYPTTVVIDRAGVVRGVWHGYRNGSESAMRSLALELLEQQ